MFDINKMRMGMFGLRKAVYLDGRDVFPNKIDVVKYYDEHTINHYVIGTLEWNYHEEDWDFESCGMRYIEDSTQELNDWLIEFTNQYKVEDGKLVLARPNFTHWIHMLESMKAEVEWSYPMDYTVVINDMIEYFTAQEEESNE